MYDLLRIKAAKLIKTRVPPHWAWTRGLQSNFFLLITQKDSSGMCFWDTCLEPCWESRRSAEPIRKLLLIALVTERQHQLSRVFKPAFYIITSVQASVESQLSGVVLQFGQNWLNLNGFMWECGISSSTCPICIPRANFSSTCLKPKGRDVSSHLSLCSLPSMSTTYCGCWKATVLFLRQLSIKCEGKCQVLHTGRSNHRQHYRLWGHVQLQNTWQKMTCWTRSWMRADIWGLHVEVKFNSTLDCITAV